MGDPINRRSNVIFIADALVDSVAYIKCGKDEIEEFLEDDLGTLESIAAILSLASTPLPKRETPY